MCYGRSLHVTAQFSFMRDVSKYKVATLAVRVTHTKTIPLSLLEDEAVCPVIAVQTVSVDARSFACSETGCWSSVLFCVYFRDVTFASSPLARL